jgi:hypothetical protein
LILPRVTSERRNYIQAGYLQDGTVISDLAYAIYNAELWVFGLISSTMHMVWVSATAGQLESRYRYSSTLCYNNFPFPKVSSAQLNKISEAAERVLTTRERYPQKSIAWLYDPESMPSDLKEAHDRLDQEVDACYRKKPFLNIEERLKYLFVLYRKMTGADISDTEQITLLEV